MEPKSLKEQLEDAWVEEDEETTAEDTGTLADEGGSGEDQPEEETVTEEVEAEAEPPAEEGEAERGQQEEDPLSLDPGAEEPAESTGVNAAPVGWKPLAREHWGKLPKEVQEQVAQREKDFATKIQQNSEAANYAHKFHETVRPYEQFFAAEGIDAIQATQNLMQTAAGLRVGTPQQKAAIVREIITQFGVDIQTLDTMLSGQQVAETGSPAGIEAILDQKLAPIQQTIAGFQNQQQFSVQQQAEQARQKLEEFASTHEFYDDVKGVMSQMADVATRSGQQVTLEDLYENACYANPQIRQILQQRNAASTATTTQSKRNAASSVKGGPAPGKNLKPSPTDLRGQIAAAWDGIEDDG